MPTQRDVINDIKTDQALMKQQLAYVVKQVDGQDKKLDLALQRIETLAFVPMDRYEDFVHGFTQWQHVTEKRLKDLEDYNSKTRLGVSFSNNLVSQVLRIFVYGAAVGFIVASAWAVIHGLSQP